MRKPDARRTSLERRLNRRVETNLAAQMILGSDGRTKLAEVRNLSLRGALVNCGLRRERIGATVLLVLLDSGRQLNVITIQAQVVNASEHECGIRFQAMDRNDFALLQNILARHGDEPAAVRREIHDGYIPHMHDWSLPDTTTAHC